MNDEHFDDDYIHTTPEGRHFRHGDGKEVDGQGNLIVECPHCGEVNQLAHADGATDGPREYHATCWHRASANMTDQEIKQAWAKSELPD